MNIFRWFLTNGIFKISKVGVVGVASLERLERVVFLLAARLVVARVSGTNVGAQQPTEGLVHGIARYVQLASRLRCEWLPVLRLRAHGLLLLHCRFNDVFIAKNLATHSCAECVLDVLRQANVLQVLVGLAVLSVSRPLTPVGVLRSNDWRNFEVLFLEHARIESNLHWIALGVFVIVVILQLSRVVAQTEDVNVVGVH